jgi:hypothetical protein
MRDLSQMSGPWVGFWIQRRLRGNMGLALSFGNGRITGTGSNLIGAFRLDGDYAADGAVRFVKTYAWHHVDYKGKWDDQMISGTWKIKYEGSGAFEIWPESEMHGFEQMFEIETRPLQNT